jgi:hypothetical protein
MGITMQTVDMERITLYLPPATKRALRVHAAEQDTAMTQIALRAIEAYLAARGNGAATAPADHAAPTGDAGQ